VHELPDSVERVARVLRDDILRNRYRAGERLPSERDLAERLKVNRGAVREAFRVLAQQGILKSGPGGARVSPLEDASLDILGHLLALDELPDPVLVSEVLEANGVLAAGWLRVLIDRGSDQEIGALRELLARIASPETAEGDYAERLHELVEQMVDSTGNRVLRLVRRGLRFHFSERIRAAGFEPRMSRDLVAPMARDLDEALAQRDGARAAEIAYSLMRMHRERSIEALEEEHDKPRRGSRSSFGPEGSPSTLPGSATPRERPGAK
jgi:GntR family transcriptional repressor for pyruvate dehydrogenase complex